MTKDKNRYLLYRFTRIIGKPIIKLLYRPEIVGKENIPENGRIIIAGNHKHALDPILVDISTGRIVHTLAKKELHDGIFGFFFRGIGSIPVDLHSKRNPEALSAAVDVLKNDGAVNVSPEGKRNYTDELLLPFKYGAAAMSQRANAYIVPYSITGDYRLFSKGLKITFGTPFLPEKNDDLYFANKQIYSRILELLKRNTESSILAKKRITSFDEWERRR